MKYSVAIEKAIFNTFHGLYPEEKISGNTIEVNCQVDFLVEYLPLTPQNMADYAKLAGWIKSVMTGPREELLEVLVSAILNIIQREWPHAVGVYLEMRKLNPQLPGYPTASVIKVSYP